ncbi:MAG: hypothetical protein ACRCWR_03230, partial [Saezia sp.]
MKRTVFSRKIYKGTSVLLFLACLFCAAPAWAVAIMPGGSVHFRLIDPVENRSEFRVWRNRYDPGDVLSEKMTGYFLRRLRETPSATSSLIDRRSASSWT